jgi:hypothetical protein
LETNIDGGGRAGRRETGRGGSEDDTRRNTWIKRSAMFTEIEPYIHTIDLVSFLRFGLASGPSSFKGGIVSLNND